MAAFPETKFVRSDGVDIGYQVVGGGPFDVVFVPGWISNWETAWELPESARFLERFTEFSRLILLDKRGTGLSDRVWWRRLERSSVTPNAAARFFRSMLELDVTPILPTIQAPTLVIHRRDTPIINAEAARWFAGQLPSARYLELPGADALPYVGDVDVVLDEVEEFLTGSRRVGGPDRVLATVVFIDISGSTPLAQSLGDRRWRDLLDDYRRTVRRLLERFRGTEIDTAGDGFLATFDGPARAVRCALAIRDASTDLGPVKELVLGSGLRFADGGTHALKGIEGEWRLFQAAAGDAA